MLRTVSRTLAIFESLSQNQRLQNLSELAEASGLTPSTTLRFVRTLERLGYVARTPGRRYQLTARSLRLFGGSVRDVQPEIAAYPYLRRMARLTGATWTFAVLDRTEAVYVASASGDDLRIGNFSIPFRVSIEQSGSAIAILSALPESASDAVLAEVATSRPDVDAQDLVRRIAAARALGYATFEGDVTSPPYQFTEVASTFAAPVLDWQGEVRGAVAAALPRSDSEAKRKSRLLEEVLHAARDLAG